MEIKNVIGYNSSVDYEPKVGEVEESVWLDKVVEIKAITQKVTKG